MSYSKMRIINTYRQFGPYRTCIRGMKYVLRKMGLKLESFNYYITHTNLRIVQDILSDNKFSPQLLSMNDFSKGDKTFFNERKLNIIKERFAKGTYEAYGIFDGDDLVFSSWISYNEFASSVKGLERTLEKEEALLLDSYCSPSYRGKGTQTYMTAFRLYTAYQKGKTTCVSLVLSENVPSNKTLQKLGFKRAFKYTTVTLFGHVFTNYHNRRNAYLSDEQ